MKKYLFLLFILLLTGCNRADEDCPVTAGPAATPVTDFVWLEDVEPHKCELKKKMSKKMIYRKLIKKKSTEIKKS